MGVQKSWFYVLLFLVVVAGLWIRVRDLDRSSFWLDEILSVETARNSPREIFSAVPPNKPPLDYLVLHFFVKDSETEFSARLPSAIYGTLTIIVIAMLAWQLWPEDRTKAQAALIAAALWAASALQIRYSQEARPYALMLLFNAGAFAYFAKLICARDKPSAANWVGFFVCSLLAMFTLYFSAIPMLINLLFCLLLVLMQAAGSADGKAVRRLTLGTVACAFVILLCVAPLIFKFLNAEEEPGAFNFDMTSLRDVLMLSNLFGVEHSQIQSLNFFPAHSGNTLSTAVAAAAAQFAVVFPVCRCGICAAVSKAKENCGLFVDAVCRRFCAASLALLADGSLAARTLYVALPDSLYGFFDGGNCFDERVDRKKV